MAKLWEGRTAAETDKIADDFNSSIAVDCRMYKEDITGSMAHAAMLAKQGIIAEDEAEQLIDGLVGILADLNEGKLEIAVFIDGRFAFIDGFAVLFKTDLRVHALKGIGRKSKV